jgi:hypothetical protein
MINKFKFAYRERKNVRLAAIATHEDYTFGSKLSKKKQPNMLKQGKKT